jgi:hypothetical protein
MSDWKHTRSFAKKMVDTAYKIKNSKDKLVAYLGNDKEVAVPPSQAQLIYEDRVQLGDFIPARPENPSVDKDFSYINITSNKTWKYDGRKLAIKSVASWAQTIASNFLSKKVGIGVSILGAFKSQSGAVDIKPSHNDTMKISTKIWGTKDGKLNVDVTYKFKHEDTENLAEVPDVTVTKVYDDITWEYDEEASRREGMPIFEYQNIEEDIGDIKDIYDVDRYQGEEGL